MEDALSEVIRLGYTIVGMLALWIGYDIGYRY